jgi:hypothetical protein
MVSGSDDVVKVASGSLIEMNILEEVLKEAGIPSRVVGDDLTAGLGTATPGTVELWVTSENAKRATKVLAEDEIRVEEEEKRDKHAHQKFPPPKSDAKPDRSKGPHHFPEPHRPSP